MLLFQPTEAVFVMLYPRHPTNYMHFCQTKITIMINYETNESYPLLRDCFEKLIRIKAEAGKERTAANYQSSWNKLSAFLGRKVNQVTIADACSWALRR